MGKATLMTPLYISVAWTVMVTYQIFTQTAVSTVLTFFNLLWPAIGEWLIPRMDLVIFIYAFSWVFVLSSVIPSVLLGKERSVLVQFFVCLILALVAFIVQNSVSTYVGSQSQVLLGAAFLFDNPTCFHANAHFSHSRSLDCATPYERFELHENIFNAAFKVIAEV